jgi:hypothetical protein
MTVAELSERMGSGELVEWLALRGIEPWGPYREDVLATMGYSYMIAGPSAAEPKKLIEGVRLPWWNNQEAKAEESDPAKLRTYLLSLGGKLEPRAKSNG